MSLADPIFEIYPNRINKKKALLAIEKYLKRKQNECGFPLFWVHNYTMDRTREFRDRKQRAGTPLQYIPHPTTWFNRDGPDEPEDSWGPPDTLKEQEASSRGPQSHIDPIWVEAHWDSIVKEYGLPCPKPLIIEKLPTILKDLVEEAWEKH